MEYETADGSHFDLREAEDEEGWLYTSATATIDGKPYAARFDQPAEDLDHIDVAQALQPVPLDNIYPLFPSQFKVAPPFDRKIHFLKAPCFTWEDAQPGFTFVADCVLNEATAFETTGEHPNIVKYHGCVVADGRITHLCLEKLPYSLTDYLDQFQPSKSSRATMLEQIRSAVEYLHSLGLAHNDVNPGNVCVREDGSAVLIDLDGCLPSGRELKKGVGGVSGKENDLVGLEELKEFLGLG